MNKSIQQKIKEIEYKAQQEIKKKIYAKKISLERKYAKMLDTRRKKLEWKQEIELERAIKKIKKAVILKTKKKIRDAKWWKPTKSPAKKKSVPKLKQKLLTLIQKYVRLYHADKNWYCQCISCPAIRKWNACDWGHYISRSYNATAIRKWNACDWGHYISRSYNATAFDLNNIRPQCKWCNWFKNGNPVEYRKWLVKKIWLKAVKELEAKKYSLKKLTVEWLEEQIKEYKEKVKLLEDKYN